MQEKISVIRRKIQFEISKSYKKCWVCGCEANTYHHVPPRGINPKMIIKIPICKKHHWQLNSGMDYTAKEKRSLRSNIRKIEKSVKNIRRKLLEK
jgi:hypothetical protein